ncbi:ABC1 kinase family protein [Pseudobacillus sp. 179-B 2D1 NHS]|uniref:ABC1 kinase family protein n=1 Tax=Pseudobacillus sp. 179-B 2D1 NHS TaxID=3374292 RepID=UPI0038791C34
MKKFSLYRMFIIITMAVKFFLQVTFFHKRYRKRWTSRTNQKWEALLKRQAAEYRETALRLEGLLIKLGQFLSTRADIMPAAFIEELEDLIDRVPSVPWSAAKALMEKEWNKSYTSMLQQINEEPVASASIGQVYKALLPNGTTVAVKVQRPGIDRIISTDFRAVRIVMWLAEVFTPFGKQTDLPALYQEMEATISQELDFLKESQNGLYFKKRYELFDKISVPFYYEEYSTKKVLVMEWIEGARITDLKFLEQNGIDRRNLAARLVEIFLEQLLQEGKFHADPHPGNILVRKDGTIILIDFGMIGEIQRNDAAYMRQLVEGIILEDYDQVVSALESLRFLLPGADKELLKNIIQTLVGHYTKHTFSLTDDFLMKQLLADIEKIVKDQPIQMPSEFAFFGRAVSTFVGILYILDPDVDLLEVSKPLIFKWLQENPEPGPVSDRTAINLLMQSVRPLLSIPRQIQQTLDEPRKYREWKQRHEHNRLEHDFLLSKKRDALFFILLSFILTAVTSFFQQELWLYGSGLLLVISFLYYIMSVRAHRKLLRRGKK